MSILYNRIKFTELVDKALAANDLASAMNEIKSNRDHLIKEMRLQHEEAYGRQMRNLTTLFQEFNDVLKDLNGASDKAAMWKKEMKFYPRKDGSIVCKIENLEVMCSDNYGTSDMLITTKLTREIRANIIDCMLNNKIYLASGPAGTGKTESCKDTLQMVGMEALVVNCSDNMDAPEIYLKQWRETAMKSGGKKCAIIFDEFNRTELDVQTAILKAFLNEGIFICVTCNPGYQGRMDISWKDTLPCVHQTFTVPPREDIMRCWLANEGVLECDEIGPEFVKLWSACEAKMSKQKYYDFGLRSYRVVVKSVGSLMRQKNDWSDARKSIANFVARILMSKLVEADRPIMLELVKEVFGDIPAPAKLGAVEDMQFNLEFRHGCALLGDNNAEKIEAIKKELDQKCNAKSASVVLGSIDEDFGANGKVVKAFREAVASTGRFHIYINGDFVVEPAHWMENMNTVLDDNKCLCLENGERYKLHDNVRVIFFMKSADKLSPATVSRLSWVA